MASRLQLTYDDLRARVGYQLGYQREPSAWGSGENAEIEDCIRSGLRRFYFPPPMGGEMYEWSFLQPTVPLAFIADQREYLLPEDYGGIVGDLNYTGTASGILRVTSDERVRLNRLSSSATGRPHMAAVRPQKIDHTQGQRWELICFPTPDTEYTVEMRYNILPDALFTARPYPYGGAAHAETILEACLAVCDERMDDMQGIHTANFGVQLATSIAMDRKHRPRNLGYNGDASDMRHEQYGSRRGDNVVITYNGQVWE